LRHCSLTFLVLWHHRIEGQQRGEIANATLQVQQQNALLETCEAAWCLFNREGLLLKSNLYEKALLDNTLRHFDDLVAVFDDSAPLIEQFRQLQKTGAPFEVQLTTVVGDQTILLKGERTSKHGSQHYCVLHMERVERPVLPTQVVEGAVLVSEIVVPILPAVTQTEQILDDLPFPLWLRDKALRLVWVNSAYATWCSSSRADVVARQLELFTPVPAKTGTKTLDGKMLAEIALREQKAQQERAYCVVLYRNAFGWGGQSRACLTWYGAGCDQSIRVGNRVATPYQCSS